MAKSNDAVRYEKHLPEALQALGAVYGAVVEKGFNKQIIHTNEEKSALGWTEALTTLSPSAACLFHDIS